MKANTSSNNNDTLDGRNSHVQAIILNRLTERHAQRQGTSRLSSDEHTTLSDYLEVAIELSEATLAQEAKRNEIISRSGIVPTGQLLSNAGSASPGWAVPAPISGQSVPVRQDWPILDAPSPREAPGDLK
ncbi:hypothetical protein MHU86_6645 [Fragilaria crotonensis]|nr:hypothetical protein MHU86_6645 [Fragilaria crotonensis]